MKITKIKLNNFLVFNDFEFELQKNCNVIFGENGSGKTSFVEIFEFLVTVFHMKNISYETEMRMQNDTISNKDRRDYLSAFSNLYKKNAMINAEGNMEVQIDFLLDSETKGSYYIAINENEQIVDEILKVGLINKSGQLPRIFSKKDNYFNPKYFGKTMSKKYDYFFKEDSKISIISTITYIYNRLEQGNSKTEYIEDIINKLCNSIVHIHNYHKNNHHIKQVNKYSSEYSFIYNLHDDYVKEIEDYKKFIHEFENFIIEIDNSIIRCDFNESNNLDSNNKRISLEMVFIKMINGVETRIPYISESSGTKGYLEIFHVIDMMKNDPSKIFIYDEYGIHFHEVLSEKVFKYIAKVTKEMDSQIIFTTHVISILGVDELSLKEKLILKVNPFNGNRKIISLKGENTRENLISKYKIGKYGGTPTVSDIFYKGYSISENK